MSGPGQDPRSSGGWQPDGTRPRSSWDSASGGWPAPPEPQAGGPWPDPGTGQWQATGSSAWGGAPGGPVQPQGGPPPEPPDRRRSSPPLLAPLIALLGLILVAGGSVFAAAKLDLVGSGSAAATATPDPTDDLGQTADPFATDTPEPAPTPTPQATAFVTPPPSEQATVPGTLLYVRDGNIWAVEGTHSTQLTNQGTDAAPSWSKDGKTIYFVQTELVRGRPTPWGKGTSRPNSQSHYATDIMSMDADGGHRKRLFQSMFKTGQGWWSTVAIQPDISPDGKTIVLVSDLGEVPTSDTSLESVLLATMSSSGRNLKTMGIDSAGTIYGALGHNDPTWSPDGKSIAFTYDNKGGGKGGGAPQIGVIKAPFKKKAPDLSRKGYANPAWSPDGRYIAAERVTEDSRDIVVLDPDTWEEVARLTNDGTSFAPEWSPNGDQIAYLHVNGLDIDVRVMTLDLKGNLTLVADQAVTVDGKVDPQSPPAWFIPADQRTPLPTRAPEAGASDASATDTPPADATDGATAAP